MATIKEQIGLMCDASDAGDMRVGVYRPAITNAARKKNGDTTLTFRLITAEFTPEDVMLDDMVVWLVVGKKSAVRELEASKGAA